MSNTLSNLKSIIDTAITKNSEILNKSKIYKESANMNTIELLDHNYKLQIEVRELKNKI